MPVVSQSAPKGKAPFRCIVNWIIVLLIVFVLIGVALGPTGGMPPSYGKGSRVMTQSRAIYELLVAYANNHSGAFPTGNSSTEIFQRLVDENHFSASGKSFKQLLSDQVSYDSIHDTALFYFEMPGKKLATSTTLEPLNVCFDVTTPLDGALPNGLPVVFSTGYKIDYAPNKAAVPIARLKPPHWGGVTYANGNSCSIWADESWGAPGPEDPMYFLKDHSIANFIPSDFKPDGKKYVQLTPDGPLTPCAPG